MTVALYVVSIVALAAVILGLAVAAVVRALDGCGPWESLAWVAAMAAAALALAFTLAAATS